MNNLPRDQLKYIITQYGRSLSEDPQRCEALLRDLCGQYRKEINVLVSAVKEGVSTDLLTSQNSVPSDLLLARLSKRLEDRLGLSQDAARWGVESWALALGFNLQQTSTPVKTVSLITREFHSQPQQIAINNRFQANILSSQEERVILHNKQVSWSFVIRWSIYYSLLLIPLGLCLTRLGVKITGSFFGELLMLIIAAIFVALWVGDAQSILLRKIVARKKILLTNSFSLTAASLLTWIVQNIFNNIHLDSLLRSYILILLFNLTCCIGIYLLIRDLFDKSWTYVLFPSLSVAIGLSLNLNFIKEFLSHNYLILLLTVIASFIVLPGLIMDWLVRTQNKSTINSD